ncbi:hypothetical protein BLNAU_6030 [Blattamonas nauphoetae]|uniref:Protein kinase domain-containing protein n=1 Tax=Blattamonas nauphoetae TaxID=2049346 RepID=A0ABQ9Y5N8_9EUKA|nr:hypothetical protein BLNAU_6030 [Blattamonas nauphoetae]
MILIYLVPILTTILRTHVSPIHSSTFNLDNLLTPSFRNGSSSNSQNISLPDGVVHSHDFRLISSSLAVKGDHQTFLRYLDGNRDERNLVTEESKIHQSYEVHSLFHLQNASLSVQRVVMDLSSVSANQDVKCAMLASSTVHISFCQFFWTAVNSIFVLRSNSPSAQISSSITLTWCTLKNAVGHLTPIVDEMRKNSSSDAFDLNIVGTTIANMKVVGADGVCVSQTNHHNNIRSFEGISTSVSEMQILNVSSLPGEVKAASSLFSQRMVGCAVWGSNNHLSGSVLRDVNGGGSFLCSNSTFDWCHTTSSERPSISPSPSTTIASHSFPTIRSISNQNELEDDPYTEKTFDGVDRLNITAAAVTFTKCQFTNMHYTATSSSQSLAGGSALYFYSSSNAVSLVSCSFSKCSVTSSARVYGGCVFMYNLRTATNTVDACTFADWYPSATNKDRQYGGGLGMYYTSAPLLLTNTNFSLSGETENTNHGGFVSFYLTTNTQSTTISQCRFLGDTRTTGTLFFISSDRVPAAYLSVTDSQFLETYSSLYIGSVILTESSQFTRNELTYTELSIFGISSEVHPQVIVDNKLDHCSIDCTSNDQVHFSELSFTGKSDASDPCINIYRAMCVVFHKCSFTDCSPSKNQYSVFYSYQVKSLVVDSCSFTRCTGGSSAVLLSQSYAFFHFCSFTNLTGRDCTFMTLSSNYASFFEGCRFDLQTSTLMDISVVNTDYTFLSNTAVVGCTSNRKMYYRDAKSSKAELKAVTVIAVEASKNEMRVGTWPAESEDDTEQQIPTFSSLSEALAELPTPPKDTFITLSYGNFTEPSLLEISQLVEIVGSALNISNVRSTKLTTSGFVSKANGKLTLRSLRLVPSSPSSVLASTEDSGCLNLLNVVVQDLSSHSACLLQFEAGSSEIRHSYFTNIKSAESLICVSGTSSLAITNTLFSSIKRNSPAPSSVESIQCASCIEGKTSGTVKVIHCRFGACTTSGRAGAIDLEKNDATSAVEMSYCCFDQNTAGPSVLNASKGDDVVLNSFAAYKTRLDYSTIQSFPSLHSFLIDSEHPIVPPPAFLNVEAGSNSALTWTYRTSNLDKSFLSTYTLQFLLETRLQNNVNTQIRTNTPIPQSMSPFVSRNSTVQVSLNDNTRSILTVTQKDVVFITLQNATLSFKYLQFAFQQLTVPAFQCDKDSSILFESTRLKLNNPILTAPFVESVGPLVFVKSQVFIQAITLDNTPFVRLIRAWNDGTLEYTSNTPLLAGALNTPFIICENVKNVTIQSLKINSSFVNSASFVSATDSTITIKYNNIQTLKSTAKGGFLFLMNGSVKFDSGAANSSSATQGGVVYSERSKVSINDGTYSNCQAEEGGVAFVVSSTLYVYGASFVSNSAKTGGVFWFDFGTNLTASLTSRHSNHTSSTATHVDENGVGCGKGGAIFVKGTTTSKTPLDLLRSHFDGNTAAFGNDVFVEESVLGTTGPNLLKDCLGDSHSRVPHLEISTANLNESEFFRISDFIPFPTMQIELSTSTAKAAACKWSFKPYCKTIQQALEFLQSTAPNGSLFQRHCVQRNSSMTTEPVVLDQHDLHYSGETAIITNPFALSLSAVEGVVFTIDDESRLTVERIEFSLTSSHQVVLVNSKDGRVVINNCFVKTESDTTTSKTPISSNGDSLIMNTVSFSPTLTSSLAALSAPLVRFAPKASEEGQLGSGTFKATNTRLTNLTFEGTTMIELITTGDVTFSTPNIVNVNSDQQEGIFLTLKGQNFKTQLKPEQWDNNLKTTAHLTSLLGEDVLMDEDDKWREGSLVYWLVSPSIVIQVGAEENAVDHPNCGSDTFKCSILNAAFRSAILNNLPTLTLLTSTTLSSELLATSSLLIKSSSETQEIVFDESGLIKVANLALKLSFESIIFTAAQTCQSGTLFVIEEGEFSFSSCVIGATSSETALVLPASTTTLIEVKASGTLTLIDTLIQHIDFSHAALGTAIRLHLGATVSSSGTKPISHLIESSWKPRAGWGPTLTNSPRFSKDEIDEFGVIDENDQADELIYSWYPYDGTTMHLHSEGGSHAKCGVSALPCSSLSGKVEVVGDGEAIVICSALTETVGFVSTKNLSVKSSDDARQVISVSCSTIFTSRDSSLSFTDLTFVPLPQSSSQNAETLERGDSLFVVESGSIELAECTLSSFVLANQPLIAYTSGLLSLESCEISSITRSTGNGTVLEIAMKASHSISLNDVTFSSMTSSKESALLAFSFPTLDESDPTPHFDFNLTNLRFVEMNKNEDDESCFVSFVGSRLGDWISEGDPRFEGSYSKTTPLNHLWSFDVFHQLPASLLFYLLPSEGPVGVSVSGFSISNCGSNSVWCPTISQSLGRLTPQKTNRIVVVDEIDLSTTISLPNDVIFSGNNSKTLCTCVVGEVGSFETTGVNVVSITVLDISLPLSQSAAAVIVHSSDKLTLSHLRVSSERKSSAVFLRMTTGTTEMSNIEIHSSMEPHSVFFSILGGSVNISLLTIETAIPENTTVVKMEGGNLSLTGMTLSTTEKIEGQLFSIAHSRFTLTDVKIANHNFSCPLFTFSDFGESTIHNMNVSGCSGSTLLTAKDGDELTLRFSDFSSISTSSTFNEAETSDLCGWETSLIEVTNTAAHFHQSEFTSIALGAVSISDAPLTLTTCTFSGNTPSNEQWPSLRRNIKCSDGSIKITGSGGGDGHTSQHHWIWTDECVVTKEDGTLHATLFVPTLVANKSTSTLDKKLKEYSVNVVGTTMIPCGLKLEVFEHSPAKSNEGHPIEFEISSLEPSKWTETELSFVLPQSSLITLNEKLDHRCRLVYGDGQVTDSFSLNGKGKGNMSQAGVITSIVVPIVVVILVALILIIVIGVLCRRRKQKEKAAERGNQELDTTDVVDVMKDEGDVQDSTIKPIFGSATGHLHNHSLLMVSNDKEQEQQSQVLDATALVPFKPVEVMMCSGEFPIVTVDPRNTLFHRLHVEKQQDLSKREIGVQLVNGLTQLIKEYPQSDFITRFSPHWILLDFNQNVSLRIGNNPNTLASAEGQSKANSTKNGEDRRWNAPEQETKEGENENTKEEVAYDTNKALVFRLGLVLWELETGLVPFGELDAVNASRQIKAGVMPLIHNWEDESLADLVRECLSHSPNNRPSLSDVKSRLTLLNSHQPFEQPRHALPDQAPIAVSGQNSS